jgi:phosphoribosylanthranilate isomerase
LAGGLSPENVYDGIRFVKPAGVDSCTGTNRLDDQGRPIRFQKDMDRLRRFVEETRRATATLPGTRDTDPRKGCSHS